MALFVVVPVALGARGPPGGRPLVGLPRTVGAGFVLMLRRFVGPTAAREAPGVPRRGRRGRGRDRVLAAEIASIPGIIAALVIFFAGFNVLEAKLPALVSRAAPREATGAATGVYSSVQFLGTFFAPPPAGRSRSTRLPRRASQAASS